MQTALIRNHPALQHRDPIAPYLKAQKLAFSAAKELATLIQPGWSEEQAACLLNTYLQDHGVRSFFHYAYAWFGERTRFDGISRRSYSAYKATKRILQENEVYILDVAPIVDGAICDIGYSHCSGEGTPAYHKAMAFLRDLRRDLPSLALGSGSGKDLWDSVDQRIKSFGYDNIHAQYPFSVLGHKVHEVSSFGAGIEFQFINFGWRSYFEFLRRGLFGELLSPERKESVIGIWAIEPHIGSREGFGVKFEEILVVEKTRAYWIEHEAAW
jgi:Xaa-Pro aminopeptidase